MVTLGLLDGKGAACYPSNYLPIHGAVPKDYVQRLIPELRKRNIGIYAWVVFNLQDLHDPRHFRTDRMFPEWKMEFMPTDEYPDLSRYRGMCLVSSKYIQWYAAVLRECAAFDVDGFFFDGFYFVGLPHPGPAGCLCRSCEAAFKEDTGMSLPGREDWQDKAFKTWIRWRNDKLLETARYFQREIQKINPRATIRFNFNTWPFPGKDWETAIPLGHFRDIGVSQHAFSKNFQDKLLILGYKSRLSFDMNPENCDIWRHCRQTATCGKSELDPIWHETETRTFMLAGLAYGTVPWRAGGDEIPGHSQMLARINGEIKAKERYFSKDYVAETGVLISQNTFDFADHQGSDTADYQETILGAWMYLTEHHIPFRFIFDNQLGRLDTCGIQTLFMPDCAALSLKAAADIFAWIQSGGHVIATGRTGSLDEWGCKRERSSLLTLAGIDKMPTGPQSRRAGKGNFSYYPGAPMLAYCRNRDGRAAGIILEELKARPRLLEIQAPASLITNGFYSADKKQIFLHLLNVSPLMREGENLFRGKDAADATIQFSKGKRKIGFPFIPAQAEVKINKTDIVRAEYGQGGSIPVVDNALRVDSTDIHTIIIVHLK